MPVKYDAARALKRMLDNEVAIQFIKPGLETIIKSYLSLMNEFDNEELVDAFESIMIIFSRDIKPYARDICTHLKDQYARCMAQDNAKEDEESVRAAVASLNSMRRILDVVKADLPLTHEIQAIMYPCLEHSLTRNGIESLEEGVDCITLILYNGYRK